MVMTTTNLMRELKRLPMDERLAFVEAAVHLVREELAPRPRSAMDSVTAALACVLAIDH